MGNTRTQRACWIQGEESQIRWKGYSACSQLCTHQQTVKLKTCVLNLKNKKKSHFIFQIKKGLVNAHMKLVGFNTSIKVKNHWCRVCKLHQNDLDLNVFFLMHLNCRSGSMQLPRCLTLLELPSVPWCPWRVTTNSTTTFLGEMVTLMLRWQPIGISFESHGSNFTQLFWSQHLHSVSQRESTHSSLHMCSKYLILVTL